MFWQGRALFAGQKKANAVILRKIKADSLDATLSQPDRCRCFEIRRASGARPKPNSPSFSAIGL
jgi:hypothetical protein